MKLLVARTVTIGFILSFTALVTTPTPVLCSHACGDIHLMGPTEHLGHEHEGDHHHDPTQDLHTNHHDSENEHKDQSCVDVTVELDVLLRVATWTVDQLVMSDAVLTTVAPQALTAVGPLSEPDGVPDRTQAPLEQLRRLLI